MNFLVFDIFTRGFERETQSNSDFFHGANVLRNVFKTDDGINPLNFKIWTQ